MARGTRKVVRSVVVVAEGMVGVGGWGGLGVSGGAGWGK